MYAFRKPFSAATFSGISYWGIDYKTLLIISQVFGYMISKFIGIKIVSEISPAKRAGAIILFILIAEAALFFFAITPAPYNVIFLFINGLPLGMVWGLVFGFLEGRKLTEVLGAGLSISFIVSSGFVKSVGKFVMNGWGVSEFYMPFITGGLFIIPLIISVYFLNQIPAPTLQDETLRIKRKPMDKTERRALFIKYAYGITSLTLAYMIFTAFRDMRDNYAAEIWAELGFSSMPMIFTYSEIPIAIGVAIILAFTMVIKDNFKALAVNHFIVIAGALLVGLSALLMQLNIISPVAWMILAGFGLYMAYVPFNCILFDRFIAAFRINGSSGFLIYIADSFGYLSSVGALLYKNFAAPNISWLKFFLSCGYYIAVISSALMVLSYIYLKRENAKADKTSEAVLVAEISK
jgi:hypothetical protein